MPFPDAGQHHRADQGGSSWRPPGTWSAARSPRHSSAGRYLRDGAVVDRHCRCRPDAPAIRMFRLVIAEARSLIRQRDEIEAQAEALLACDADAARLRQIPGIGPINALTIIGRSRRPAPFRPSSPVSQVLRVRPLRHSSRACSVARPGCRSSATLGCDASLWLAGQVAIRQRENGFRRAIAATSSRDRDNPASAPQGDDRNRRQDGTRRACRRRSGSDYRPFVEGPVPGGRTSLS